MAKTPTKSPNKSPHKKSTTAKSSLDSFLTKKQQSTPTKARPSSTATSSIRSPSRIATVPAVPCDIADGWTVKSVPRKPGSLIHIDRYYYSPEGDVYRSRKEALRSLGMEDGGGKRRKSSGSAKKKEKAAAAAVKSKEKTKSPSSSPARSSKKKQKYPIGTSISKIFQDPTDGIDRPFRGKVTKFDSSDNMYYVSYEDGDGEEMSEGEIGEYLDKSADGGAAKKSTGKKKEEVDNKNTEKKKKSAVAADTTDEEESSGTTPEQSTSSGGRRRASAKKVNYRIDESEEEEFIDEDNVKPKAKKAKQTKKKGKNKKGDDSDTDDFAPGEESEDDELMDDAGSNASSDDNEVFVKKKQPTKKKSASSSSSAPKAKKEPKQEAEGKTKMSDVEGIKKTLKNNPDYFKMTRAEIKATQSFLDPCGMEATDDIIDRLVGHQLDRISNLLTLALKGDALGSKSNPLVLGTACSGTDAPALALMLNQEQLEARGMGGLFKYEHVFSCEKEPYKQAYLARNFDSTLYPDIVKLCDNPPRDVYGQEKPLPEFNIFVAGTSCKNFSMMMSNKRLDIEDKGCSGETFLAACELLMKDKPKFAIFENVTKAPWEKMSEYITGRLNLATVDDGNKSIKGASKGKEGELELTLQDGKILTHKVPSQVGCQCGAVVKGYTKGSSRKVQDVTWPNSSKKTCTLTEFVKHNGIDKKTDTLYLETDVVYCTRWLKVDTKEFGLPQTRERTYMFVWQPDDENVDDDLGDYWEAVVEYLQFPVRHALESFILEANHDVIRVFREALNGPAGRYTSRAVNQAPDFWDKSNANANLPHNLNTRAAIGMNEYARPQTKWGAYGKMQVPPHYWLEYQKCINQRQLDMLDILHGSAARDAESHDSNFASYFWNISQNVSREKHRTSRSGIAGCITPGGDVFLPHAGRPLLGCEKLLLQGIPYFRLLLGNETEVQLGDLAGNAMSLTVVNATMLAAVTAKQLRREHKKSGKKNIVDTLKMLSKVSRPAEIIADADVMNVEKDITSASSDTKLFKDLCNLANEAIKSSIWCTCETSGRISRTSQFLQCRVCSVACCRDCCHEDQGYQLGSHDIKDVSLTAEHDPSSFEMKFRSIMPASLLLSSEGIEQIASISNDKYRIASLAKYTYSLHQIKQSKMKWLAIYYARDEKTSETLAELKITVGELERKADTADPTVGVKCELTSFVPAKREPFEYGEMPVCASAKQLVGENDLVWKVKDADETTTLSVVGSNPSPSFRIQVGLNDVAVEGQHKAIKTQHKAFAQAKSLGEERRWLYVKNWKDWPSEITVSGCPGLAGRYLRVGCEQTFNQSACWIRKQDGDDPELYLLLKPDVGRTGPDVAVISSSSNYLDASSIRATFPLDWQPSDALIEKTHTVSDVSLSSWKDLSMKCYAFANTCTVESPKVDDSSLLLKVKGLAEDTVTDLCCRDDESGEKHLVPLNVYRGAKALQTVRRFNLSCLAEMLKHAAAHGLKYDMGLNSSWNKIEPKGVPFGCCLTTIPPRPTETWSFDTERDVWERNSEPGASRKYFLALQSAPQCFSFVVDRKQRSLAIECHPEVACHHAAFGLIDGRGDGYEKDVSVDFRFLSVQEDPILDRFKLHNCQDLPETNVPLKDDYELYERQKKAVTKMVRIERGEVGFEEIEMNEQTMPGSAGWSLLARAKRMTKLRGGVIADAIGAGKTVISIAIVLQGIQAARKNRCFPRKTSATLVVVPPGLIDQWKREVKKFTDDMPKVICIYDGDAMKNYSLKTILEADMVICPVDLLEAKGYMARLARIAAGVKNEKEVPQLPKETGQVEKNGASGVWIPATSQDPFGGANNPRSQQRRDESAYFTHVYHDYIRQLREKKFEHNEKGIPLEYFEWERVFIDEIHECLCTSKDEMKEAKASKDKDSGFFKEKNRRAGREFLGITTKDTSKRPLVFRQAIFGLTATPLLDSTNRVIELANLMGNAYVIGLSSHWRNLERESGRDIFLSNFLEPKQSREIRKQIYSKCQNYLDLACCKNKNEEDMEGIEKVHVLETVKMTEEEGVLYKKSQSGMTVPSYSTKVEDFDVTAGHDISKFLRRNANLVSRGKKLVEICKNILSQEGSERSKIIVFADGRIGAGNVARDFLNEENDLGCTWLDEDDTVQEKNKKLGWYQYADVTEEDKKRPRVLVLHFEHAAGLNLQAECNNLILFTPLYGGEGGTSGDVVADVSTEMQAIGRVFRPGQSKSKVYIYRIEVKGPNGEECLDGQLIRRNTDEATQQMAVNADD